MGDLHRWRICITVNGNRLDAKPLRFKDHFLPKLTRAEKHNFTRMRC